MYSNSLGKSYLYFEGYSSKTMIYDKRGFLIYSAFFDEKLHLKKNNQGYERCRYENNDKGLPIKISLYNEKDSLSTDEFGVAIDEYKWDDNNNMIQVSCFDSQMKFCLNNKKVYIERMSYDVNGNLIEIRCYNTRDKLCLNIDAWAINKLKYDVSGRVIESIFLNEKGSLAFNKNKISNIKIILSSNGNWDMQYYDENCNLSGKGVVTLKIPNNTYLNKIFKSNFNYVLKYGEYVFSSNWFQIFNEIDIKKGKKKNIIVVDKQYKIQNSSIIDDIPGSYLGTEMVFSDIFIRLSNINKSIIRH